MLHRHRGSQAAAEAQVLYFYLPPATSLEASGEQQGGMSHTAAGNARLDVGEAGQAGSPPQRKSSSRSG